jgi:hypothetical protein
MSLGLLFPAFLAALAALAVPIWLHLRHSDKDKPFRFPSLMFLEKLPIRTASRRRLVDVPLLLLRLAAITLLVLAFGRPYYARDVEAAMAQRPRAIVVLLDRSGSMGHTDVWAAAQDSARAKLVGIQQADRVALVVFDEEAEIAQSFTSDVSLVRAAIAAAKPGDRGTRYAAALRAARQLLSAAPDATHEVYVVTDVQRSGVSGLAGLDLPTGMTIAAVPVSPKRRANSAIAAVDVRRIAGQRVTVAVQARVVTRELPGARRVRATLALNGRPSGSRDVTLPASGDFTIAFDAVPLPSGRVSGTISLEKDALAFDDVFRFTLPDEDELRVLLVVPDDAGSDETVYFERALGIGKAPTVRIERRRPGTLDARSLRDAALVVLWDARPTGAALETWVRGGGGLVVAAGARLAARPATSPLVPATIAGMTDRLADRGGTFGEFSREHPLFTPFRDANSSLGLARFLRYPRLEPGAGSDVIARFDDGQPAVVERREGAGRIIMIGAPLHAGAGDLPLQPTYLPLLRRVVLHTSGHESAPLWRLTGESWNPQAIAREPVVSTPSGEIVRPLADSAGTAVALKEAGVYSLYDGRVTGEPAAIVAVNPPPGESDLTPVDPRELLLGVRLTDQAVDADHARAAPRELEGNQGLWRAVLAIVVLVLLVETLLATRGWRGIAGHTTVAPSERSAS